jgi:hypothetical protein
LGFDRRDDWAKTNRYTNRRTDTTTRTLKTDEGSAITRRGESGGVGVGDGGNIYAGQDGNVYRRQGDTWQKYENSGWTNTDRQPGDPRVDHRGAQGLTERSTTLDRGTRDQLNRDSDARRDGMQRTKDFGSYRGGSGTRGTGSFRGGGAGRAGGGRRR